MPFSPVIEVQAMCLGIWRETMKYAEEIAALAIIVIVGGAILGPIIAALITYHL